MKAQFLIWLTGIWNKSKKTIWLILAFLCVLSIGYFAGCNRLRKERGLNVANIIAIRDTVKHYSVEIDGLENSVAEKNAIILSQTDAIKAGLIERDLLKKLHISDLVTNTSLTGTIKVLRDSLNLPPNTIFITIKDTSGKYNDYVKVPFQLLNVNEKYLSLDAGMRINRKAYFNLSVPFTGQISVGYKKTGLFKTTPVGIYTSDNPYIHINSMDVLIIEDKKGLFTKWWFHALFGGAIVETANILLKK